MEYKCRCCGEELTDKNWHWYKRKNHSYVCRKCCSEQNKEYQRKNKEKYRKIRLKSYYKNKKTYKDYNRKHRIGTVDEDGNKKVLFGNKRDYPLDEKCEVCHVEGRRLVYHHWDDEHIELGIWVCTRCHNVAEYIDSGMGIDLYPNLKRKVVDKEI